MDFSAHDSVYHVHDMVGWLSEDDGLIEGPQKTWFIQFCETSCKSFFMLHPIIIIKKKLVWQGMSTPISDY